MKQVEKKRLLVQINAIARQIQQFQAENLPWEREG
jgi:hypothetical protein